MDFKVGEMYLDTGQLKNDAKNFIYIITNIDKDYTVKINWLSGDEGYMDRHSIRELTKNDVRIDNNNLIRILYGM